MSITTAAFSPASLALREVAASDPGRAVIEVDGRAVSYGELNAQADRLAHRVLELVGVAPAQVAYRVLGTHEMGVAAVAIQRAGMVAVPVDPTAPEDRVRLILQDVDAQLLITDVPGDAELGLRVPVIGPFDTGSAPAEPVDRPRGELASIIYTSGSTGTPKGVMLGSTQTATLYEQLAAIGWVRGSRMGTMQGGSVGAAELPIGATMMMGSTLVAYEVRRHLLAPLADWIDDSELAALGLLPTVLRFFLPTLDPDRRFPGIERLLLFSETSTWADVAAIRRHLPQAEIINMFGQSETFSVASYRIPPEHPLGEGPLPSGSPPPGIELRIADESGAEVAPGEPGEIIVRGASLALGYWRRPDLTHSNFLELPDGRREVRMGDAGRIRADGVLEHLGRLDHVVKVYGNRVELGEIEAGAGALAGVADAAAAPFTGEDGQTRIILAIVRAPGMELDARQVRVALSRRLPGYMIPARIAFIDALPQLPNGKLDRVAVAQLPDAEASRADGDAPPAGELERQLAALWCELLGRESVGRHDDFFEIGGDSLLAGEMFVEIAERLGCDQPVTLLAEARTVASLALMLSDADSWEAPLAFHTDGDRPPLFVVHDGGGNLLFARTLSAHLGADQPVYGLRCGALNGRPFSESSFIRFVGGYVERLRSLYPDGPVLLYGVSAGGAIAMEMARQLIELGIDVPLVVLGDTAIDAHSRELRRARQRHELAALGAAGQARYLMDLARTKVRFHAARLSHALPVRRGAAAGAGPAAPDPVPSAERGDWALQAFIQLDFDHDVRAPYPGRVTLLRTEGPWEAADRGWRRYVGAALEIIDLPGTHLDLSAEASSAYVGPALAAAIASTVATAA